MKIKHFITIILLLPSLLFGAEWEELNMRVIDKSPSDEIGSTRYTLNDPEGRAFEANYPSDPGSSHLARAVSLKDTFYSWQRISVEKIEFFFPPDAIQANLRLKAISYQNENLMSYLPAGLAFQDTSDGLHYNFRIVVNFQSYMLDGLYTDEEALLAAIYSFVKEKEEIAAPAPVEIVQPEAKVVTHRFSVFASPGFLLPTGKMARLFQNGYGGIAGVTVHDAGVSLTGKTLFDLDVSLFTGFWNFTKKDSLGGETSSRIDSAFIIPMGLGVRYPFPFYKKFYLAPTAAVGVNFSCIDYLEPVAGAEDNLVKIRALAPSITPGLQFGYVITEERLTFLADVQHIWMFERHMTPGAFVFQAGVEYSFMMIGK